MGVTVGYAVGETSVLIVGVAVSVGLGGVIRLNPPQLIRMQVSADTPTRTLLVIVSRIHITDVSVSFRCDGWIYRG